MLQRLASSLAMLLAFLVLVSLSGGPFGIARRQKIGAAVLLEFRIPLIFELWNLVPQHLPSETWFSHLKS